MFGEVLDGNKKCEDPRHVFCCCTVEDGLVLVGSINLVNGRALLAHAISC